MALKILVNALGQHILADVKQVTNTETEELLAYWVKEPRVISYKAGETGQVSINFLKHVPVAVDQEYSISAHHIVSILTPSEPVAQAYMDMVYPQIPKPTTETTLNDVPESTDTEERDESGSSDE